jgi:hypothetical protein
VEKGHRETLQKLATPWTTAWKSTLPCLVALSCLLLLTACETTIPSGASYVVAVPRAGFYRYGPAQSFGPDFMLDENTKLTINQYALGFSRVTTDNGMSGYISNDDIKPAPPAPPTAREAASARRKLNPVFAPRSKSGDFQPTPGSPLFEDGDLAPLPADAPPAKKPGFRF